MNTWCYRFEPSGGGTDVTESFELTDTPALRGYWALVGWARGRTNRNGMRTISRLNPLSGQSRMFATLYLQKHVAHAHLYRLTFIVTLPVLNNSTRYPAVEGTAT